MTARRFGRRFQCKVAIAHRTLGRHFGWWRKEVRLLCVSPTHSVRLVFAAFTPRPILDQLRTPVLFHRKSARGWCRRVNETRRMAESAFVFTWCTGTCQSRARQSYGHRRRHRTRRTCICTMWHKPMDTKERCNCRWEVWVGAIHLGHYTQQTVDKCCHCLLLCTTFYVPLHSRDTFFSGQKKCDEIA